MANGKDPQTADGLGGVHKVGQGRQPAGAAPRDPEPVAVVEGRRAGFSRLVEDPDQLSKVVHTIGAGVEPPNDSDARESTLLPARTPKAPFQDAQISPDEPSVWTAARTPPR
ncbi:hypothetical protein [Caulobacter endophyticus]|nr:hypothetical protein [Caulobacter endophyticus]